MQRVMNDDDDDDDDADDVEMRTMLKVLTK
jgi:hypothetical protein